MSLPVRRQHGSAGSSTLRPLVALQQRVSVVSVLVRDGSTTRIDRARGSPTGCTSVPSCDVVDVGEGRGARRKQRDRERGAVARGEAGQALQLPLLDQPAAMRGAFGVGARLRDLVARAAARRARPCASTERNAPSAGDRQQDASASSDQAGRRRAGAGRVELARHAAGEKRLAAGFDGESHRARHAHRIVAPWRSRCSSARRRSRAPSRSRRPTRCPRRRRPAPAPCACSTISRRFHGLRMPMPEPISDASGMIATQPMRFELARDDRIVGRVDHHVEAVGDQRLGGLQRLAHVGKQRVRIAQHLELAQRVAVEQLAAEPQRAHRVVGGVAAGGVRQVGELATAAAHRAATARPRSGRCWCGGSRR